MLRSSTLNRGSSPYCLCPKRYCLPRIYSLPSELKGGSKPFGLPEGSRHFGPKGLKGSKPYGLPSGPKGSIPYSQPGLFPEGSRLYPNTRLSIQSASY